MPQLGETVTEGTIIRWMKKVGDEIAYDEPLFEVSTDKVDSEVPSPASGYLAEILVAEGATVDVGTRLAVVTEVAPSGTVLADSAGAPAGSPPEPAASEPAPRRARRVRAGTNAGGGDRIRGGRPERKGARAVPRRPEAGCRAWHRPGFSSGHW